MAFNKVLIPTAAVAGAFGAVGLPAMAAAQGADNPMVLSFEGAVGSGNRANAYGEAKIGEAFDVLDDDVAFVGSVGLSRSINEDWDWSLSVSQLGYSDNSISDVNDPLFGSSTNDQSRSEVNFSFGREVAVGTAQARLGLGLAYAKASAEKGLDIVDTQNDYFFRTDLQTDFQGIGPRFSVDLQSAPVSSNGKLSVIVGVEVNILAGQYDHSKGFEAYYGQQLGPFDVATSDNGTMMTGGIKLGLQYEANENTSFRAGIRHDVSRMDIAAVVGGPSDIVPISVGDERTSFFVGMKVGF